MPLINGMLFYLYFDSLLNPSNRGWGRSVHNKHERGLTGPTTRVLADITSMLRTLLPTPVPLFLMGHSMGGAEILHYASSGPSDILAQIRGFIASAPLISLHSDTRPFKATVIAGRLAGRVLPKFQLVNKLDPKWLSRDPEQNKLWEQDELCHDTGTLEGLAGMLDRGLQLENFKVSPKESAGEGGKTRLLALHGTGDHVNAYEATKTYVERCTQLSDRELKSYDGWYHNSKCFPPPPSATQMLIDLFTVHAEPGDDKLMFAKYVSDWISQRLEPEESKSKL